jgi:hypothetical protein
MSSSHEDRGETGPPDSPDSPEAISSWGREWSVEHTDDGDDNTGGEGDNPHHAETEDSDDGLDERARLERLLGPASRTFDYDESPACCFNANRSNPIVQRSSMRRSSLVSKGRRRTIRSRNQILTRSLWSQCSHVRAVNYGTAACFSNM